MNSSAESGQVGGGEAASAPSRRRLLTRAARVLTPSPQRMLLLALASLTMCYVMLYCPGTWETMTGWITSDAEAAMLDRYRSVARRQIQWMQTEGEGGGIGEGGLMGAETGGGGNGTERCRNTVQGASRVADDRGYVCGRADVDASGCCAGAAATSRTRFTCDACRVATAPVGADATAASSECCDDFETCVSCCMRPDQKEALLRVLDTTRGHRLRAILSARDQFELCSALCRTSSLSVRHENKYRDERSKHCFVHEEPAT
ncbi:hypothetical protein PFISCL1PPCAC_8735 [Pristionchus fissidentatus]|uniref:SREBP regulating gene protein n=1 Tax=Pristionchus fissidentatus TaxID=1538716 RepID=A0AAV5VGU8_9BILA|nr:hypothetical protein PFISCL1PPCAC_8735 [Pristionchus fissidentatus]